MKYSNATRQITIIVTLVIAFAILASLALLYTRAATSDSISLEAEDGTTAGLVAVIADSDTSSAGHATLNSSPNPSTSKKMILHQQLPPDVAYLAANTAKYDALPFDGTSYVFDGSTKIQRPEPIDIESLRANLAPIKNAIFQRSKYNLPLVYATPSGSFDNYQTFAQNFGKLALVAKEIKADAIKYDVEEYFGAVWRGEACGSKSESECQQSAYAAGNLVMSEVVANWPNAKILTSFGPWLTARETSAVINSVSSYNDIAFANPYVGPFIAGMIKATQGTDAYIIDGGELYTLVEENDFVVAKNWMKTGVAELDYIVPAADKANFSDKIKIGFGIYDWPAGFAQAIGLPELSGTPSQAQTQLTNALKVADEYVWYYDEQHNFADNPRSGSKPNEPGDWITALQAAYSNKP